MLVHTLSDLGEAEPTRTGTGEGSTYAIVIFGESFFLGGLLLLPLLLLLVLLLLLLLLMVACLANAESVRKLPLCSELSTRVPARISFAKIVIG